MIPKSVTSTMFAWLIDVAARASRRKRWIASWYFANCGCSTFTATGFLM